MAPLAFAKAVQETLEKVLALPVEREMTLLSYYLTILLSYHLTILPSQLWSHRRHVAFPHITCVLSYYSTILPSCHYRLTILLGARAARGARDDRLHCGEHPNGGQGGARGGRGEP